MRFLRQQNINRRAPNDVRLYVDMTDSIVMKTTNNITLPTGTTAQRPVSPINGMLRYNTDIVTGGEMEIYQSGTWRSLRFKESTQITQQNLGAGDSVNIYFGPLSPAPPTTVQSNTSWGAQNVLVIVENVIQLSTTNYTVVQNPTIPGETYIGTNSFQTPTGATTIYFNTSLNSTGASGNGTTVTLTFDTMAQTPFAVGSSIVVTGFSPTGYNGTYTVTASTTSSVSYLNATSSTMTVAGNMKSTNSVYPAVDITGATITGSANIQAGTTILTYLTDPITDALISVTISQPTITSNISVNTSLTITDITNVGYGYFLKFSSPVPLGKPVTVLHGFDK
jgi:hypothetical protein